MDYITRYYKNLSEELSRKLTLLEMDVAQVAPTSNPSNPSNPLPPSGLPGGGYPHHFVNPSAPPYNPSNPGMPSQGPGSSPGGPPIFDPDGDGVPNQAPPPNAPTRQKGEPLEEHRFRVQEWRRLKDAYERYLQELRKYNDQRAKERKRRRP